MNSQCCDAPVILIDDDGREFYECTDCKKECEVKMTPLGPTKDNETND